MIEETKDAIQRSPVLKDTASRDEVIHEERLRPQNFGEYIGQERVKHNLSVCIDAAKIRQEPLDHILLHGFPGLGKTSLARIIAHEMNVSLKSTSGPAIEKPGDLAALLSNLSEGDILFIDEIHRLKTVVEEVLYSAMEDYALDLVMGKGPSARTMRFTLPRFTLIGATTRAAMLSSPLRSRFGSIFKLDFYDNADIAKIISRSAHLLGSEIDEQAAQNLAKSARHTPRIANRLLKRARDFATLEKTPHITAEIVEKTLTALEIDHLGLDKNDRQLLATIHEKFNGGPVGLSTLAAAISEEKLTIEDMYEPFLLKQGMLERTPRGRKITKRAHDHLFT